VFTALFLNSLSGKKWGSCIYWELFFLLGLVVAVDGMDSKTSEDFNKLSLVRLSMRGLIAIEFPRSWKLRTVTVLRRLYWWVWGFILWNFILGWVSL